MNASPAAPAPRPLTFDVVIATRNRPEALALSIPLLLGQSRRPQKLIVIDSSENHAAVVDTVKQATAGHDLDVIVEHAPKGLTRQRNLGLRHVTADVVFLPDDDALFHPGTSAAMMAIYERDTEGKVAALNPADTLEPPPGVLDAATYQMTSAHRRMARSVRLRTTLGRLLPEANPRFVIGRILLQRAPHLPWLADLGGVHVEWMTGYRMSFRSAAIKAVGFEPAFAGYSLFEDTDASWAVTRFGCVVGTNAGKIYHHRSPSGRANAFGLGAMGLANLAYLLAKHCADLELGPAVHRHLKTKTRRYARIRMLAARLKALRGDKFARENLRGMQAAWTSIDLLFDTPRDNLTDTYAAVKSELGLE